MTERDIFAEAMQISSPDERLAFLDRACGDDEALRKRVSGLLDEQEKLGNFLEVPAAAVETIEQPISERGGQRIGRYRLLEQIGEGGMGTVWVAEQTEPVKRRVALKLIKPGMDSRQVLARFEAQRQALALMEHPHIAKVFDAGATESGRPYFVMELVKGVPITEFCDKNHMPIEQRLKLFLDVCRAIQHAHQKGIIHRDIKPTNVLVTLHDGVPVVKVIDFGLAKATVQTLTEKTLFTAFGQMVGTPAYMSPEQAELSGLDIDTRSDVYSLGVLLYELLTGTTPLESKRLREAGYAEMQRLIREEEPPRPSIRLSSLGDSATVLAGNRGMDARRLAWFLAGDIDCIVLKALEKDRNRRYSTPENFSDDVERYLRREAILARPPSTAYKVKKFIQRNMVAVSTAAAVTLALLIGIGVVTWQVFEAEKAKAVAEEHDVNARNHVRSQSATGYAMGVQISRTKKLEQEAFDWSNRIAAKVAQDPRLRDPELQGVREDLLHDLGVFWDRWIAVDSPEVGASGGGDVTVNIGVVTIKRGKVVGHSEFFRRQRILVLAYEKHGQAAQDAEALWKGREKVPPGDLAYDLARVYGLCAQAASDNSELKAKYGDRALDFLAESEKRGYFSEASHAAKLSRDPAFALLRPREDFIGLVRNAESNRK